MKIVTKTVRERACDKSAPISHLVIHPAEQGFSVFRIEELLEDARGGRLYSKCVVSGGLIIVYIFWRHGRWIATTRADGIQCNNLLSLPVMEPSWVDGKMTHYQLCPF